MPRFGVPPQRDEGREAVGCCVAMLVAERVGHVVTKVSAEFRGKESQEPPEPSFGPHWCSASTDLGMFEQDFAPADRERLFEARRLARATSRPMAVSAYVRRRAPST